MVIHRTKKSALSDRDIELENICGNLFIAMYQVDRLKARLRDMVSGVYGHTTIHNSTYDFEKLDKKYRITLSVQELNDEIEKVKDEMKDKDKDREREREITENVISEYDCVGYGLP